MDFTAWLAANGYDETKLSDAQRKHLEAAWKAETQPKPPPPPVAQPVTTFDDKMAAIEAESKRVEFIHEATARAAERHIGNLDKVKQIRDLGDTAVLDKKMDTRAYELALLRLDRLLPPMVMAPATQQVNESVLEAAICVGNKLPGVEKMYSDQTLQVAQTRFKRGLGITELLAMAAEQNSGYRGSRRDLHALLKAAWREGGDDGMYSATSGPSTINVANILANVANKFMRVAFMAIDSAWRSITAIRSVNDYKAISTVALTGDLQYEELPPGGEIQHGSLADKAYANQASIFAKMLGLDERDLRNDDTGALASASTRLGRGAALALNDKFWSIFLNNSSFFSAGNSNVITGGTSVLSGATGLEALRLGDEKFRLQTDPDGKPLGSMPRILLVPSSLRVSALNLMNSTTIVGSTTANSMMPDQNVFAGAFNVVSSPYLQNASYTGFSTTAWYLLADPGDLPVIETVFLDGIETPTIETTDANFNMLGIQMRGVLKFGVALQEFRGGVRAAGA